MELLATIAIHHEEDREYIRKYLDHRTNDQDIEIRMSEGAFRLFTDPQALSERAYRHSKQLARTLARDCFSISFYDNDKLNQNFDGSARAEGWKINMPKLQNGLPDYRWNHRAIHWYGAKSYVFQKHGALTLANGWSETGIQIMQFDTGYSDHPVLKNNPGYMPREGAVFAARQDTNKDEFRAYDLAAKGYQKPGHGTATGGTIMAVGGLNENEWPAEPEGLGIKNVYSPNLTEGLFPYVKFIPVKISETVTLGGKFARSFLPNVGDSQNLNDGLDYAIQKGVDIVTMSMGGSFGTAKVIKKYREAYHKGIIMTCAAGNAKKADRIFNVIKPAEFAQTIGIAAVEPVFSARNNDWLLKPWNQSCDGLQVDIAAPGRYIYAPMGFDPKRINDPEVREGIGDGFAYKFGGATSQATVHVASAAALWKHCYRNELNSAEFREDPWKIVEAFRFALYASKYVPSNWTTKNRSDYNGVLNADRMLHPDLAPDCDACDVYLEEVDDLVNSWRKKDNNRRGVFNRMVTAGDFGEAFKRFVLESEQIRPQFRD